MMLLFFFGFLIFPIIFYYSFYFLHDIGAKDEIQHHYANNSVLANEGGVGATRNMVHVNVIVNVVRNNLGVDGHFGIMDVFISILKVFWF